MQETEGETLKVTRLINVTAQLLTTATTTTTEDRKLRYVYFCSECHSKTIHNACAFILFIITITAVARPTNQKSKETIKRNKTKQFKQR